MKRKFPLRLIPASLLFLSFAQTGCYSYSPYGNGYGENRAYYGAYPGQPYGSNYPNGHGHDDYSRGHYWDNDDDDNDDRNRGYDQNRPWQGNPYGGYYGR
jgi:hypothetical protein